MKDTLEKDSPRNDFFNLYRQGFIRVAVCIPAVRVADTAFNAAGTIELAHEAAGKDAILALFPELGISAYSNEDLFHQETLLKGVHAALDEILKASMELNLILVVGAPLVVDYGLFNCGIVIYQGRIQGVTVKSHPPNYREFYEGRHFRSAAELPRTSIDLCGQEDIPIGANLIFTVKNIPLFSFFIESCEDLWVPVPPSSLASLAGATVICNLSASNVTVGKSRYRHQLATVQSARCHSAYLYAAAGPGESTTDLAWDGQAMIYEDGILLAESARFRLEPQIIYSELDLDLLAQERIRLNTFSGNALVHRERLREFRPISFTVDDIEGRLLLERSYGRFPYLPLDQGKRNESCYESYNIQVQGLTKRLKFSGISNLVIGVSGGLDSTHALIVAARTMDLLGFPRQNIKAYTMPGFATSDKTYRNACRLMEAIGAEVNEIDIKPSCIQMLKDIGHPLAQGGEIYDTTYENIQAGERASHLFRLANLRKALVVGTGDLSELAQGWCTYGVGDQMSHYNVNAGLPKTFIQYLIRWVADTNQFSPAVSAVLYDILDTEISPELIPSHDLSSPSQKTEETIGPYELQDFNLFYTLRHGFRPTKIAFLSYCAWRDKAKGLWPEIPQHKRHDYTIGEIKRWLEVFLLNFFQNSQYKRSCLPNGPKVGSGGSLSPRGDHRAPSDSEASLWLADAASIPDEDTGR
ncbi:MAG: NAD(+) synthase [Smithellaceae bacterium]|nr:NAD(+) synthase [Smithellaceae bacterium]